MPIKAIHGQRVHETLYGAKDWTFSWSGGGERGYSSGGDDLHITNGAENMVSLLYLLLLTCCLLARVLQFPILC